MSDQSTILSLPHILPSQAQKHVTHNEALRLLDVMVQLAVAQRSLASPPASPALGDRYIVAAAPTGAWAAHQNEVALWNGTAWEFFAPLAGWRAYVTEENAVLVYDGSAWTAPGGVAEFDRLGVAMAADAVNKLAVASSASLFTNPAGSHRLAISKAAAGDTGSVLFQQNFVGHAEIGLVGDNDLTVKVSPDGTSFLSALRADRTSGRVTFDQPLRLNPTAGDAASAVDGFLWYNSTTGKFRARQGGVSVDLIGAAGSGDVVGPALATDNALARFDLTTGKLVQDSGVTLSDSGDLALPTAAWPTGAWTLARGIGTNGALNLTHRGTGAFQIAASEAAEIRFSTNGTVRARLASTGAFAPGANLGTSVGELASRFSDVFAARLNLGSTSSDGVVLSTGAGSPEGAVTAVVGSLYQRNNGAAGTTLYVKETGTGNTGWTAVQSNATHTGDVTGSAALTIANDAVSNAKLANVGTATLKGRASAGTGDPEDLTGTQATALLDVFASATKGLAPASGGGTTNFLRADGVWAVPNPWSYVKLAADSVVSTTTHADVTGMSFAAAADAVYEVEIFGAMQAAATTTGLGVALKIPSGTVDGMTIVPSSTTANQVAMQRADDAVIAPTTGVGTAAVNWPIFGKYLVVIGSTGGTVQLRQRSEVAGSNTTLMAGLRMKVRQIPA